MGIVLSYLHGCFGTSPFKPGLFLNKMIMMWSNDVGKQMAMPFWKIWRYKESDIVILYLLAQSDIKLYITVQRMTQNTRYLDL